MAKKDKKRHNFWKRLHFKYRLSILNENTLEETWKLRVSLFHAIMLFITLFFLIVVVTSVIIISTPIRNYLPGYLDSEIRDQAIRAAIQIDSLELQQKYQMAQMQNIKDIFEGKVQPDQAVPVDTVTISEDDKLLKTTNKELDFRDKYEKEELYNVSPVTTDSSPIEGITFFRPARGVISQKFDPAKKKYGIDISLTDETVVATLEGTVIFAGYDPVMNYVIQLQHRNGFISIYQNTSLLLKKVGDKVRTGEAIAVVNNGNDKNKLLFELWYKGNPVNPELYISF